MVGNLAITALDERYKDNENFEGVARSPLARQRWQLNSGP